MNLLELWNKDKFWKLVISAYQHGDNSLLSPDTTPQCPYCSGTVKVEPVLNGGLQRKDSCTSCGSVFPSKWLVKANEAEIYVESLPTELELHNTKSSPEDALLLFACKEGSLEVTE